MTSCPVTALCYRELSGSKSLYKSVLNDVVLLDIPKGTSAGAARSWTVGVHGGEREAGKGSPASCAFPGLCETGRGQGKGELLPCTAVSSAQLREALGAEGCEMQQRPGGSSE